MKRCAVVCNGAVGDYRWLADKLSGYDAVFAADGGLDHCRRARITPVLALGDMDSLTGGADGAREVRRHPAEKDRSDMEIAVDHAIHQGYDVVDVFGALGGRIDHELCNCMVCARHPGVVRLVDDMSTITAIGAGQRFEGAGSPGDIVTLLALDAISRCATEGLRYTLNRESLSRGSRGLSNSIENESFSVSVFTGTILVVHVKGHRNSA